MKVITLNSILYSGILYGLYLLIAQNTSFIKLNRFVLLSIPLFAIGIPVLSPLYQTQNVSTSLITQTLKPIEISLQQNIEPIINTHFNTLFILYILGFICASAWIIMGITKVYTTINIAQKTMFHHIPYASSASIKSPFSFFNHIVVPQNLEKDPNKLWSILLHENVHRIQKHSWDNLYLNILSVIFWFNPFIHLISKEIKRNHEYAADAGALKHTPKQNYTQILLSETFNAPFGLMSSAFFNSSLIKTRIVMMYKSQTPKSRKLTYLLFVPLLIAFSLYSCNKADQKDLMLNSDNTVKQYHEITKPPLFSSCDENASQNEQKKCFINGITQYLGDKLEYPEMAKKLNIEGRLLVEFIVDENGNYTKVEVLKSIEKPVDANNKWADALEDLENYTVKLMKNLPEVSPAELDGKKVSVKYVVPIQFKLS